MSNRRRTTWVAGLTLLAVAHSSAAGGISARGSREERHAMRMQDAIKLMARHIGQLPVEGRLTLPIVQRAGGPVLVHRLVYEARPTPEGLVVSPPQMIATVDLDAGQFVSYRRLTPQEYPAAGGGGDMPRFQPPTFPDPSALVATYERLYSLYDVLIPAYLEQRDRVTDTTRESAREFRRLFDQLSEPPLRPYYASFGGDFFAWTEAASR